MKTLTAQMEQEQTLMPETQSRRIARLLKIYNGIKPLLTVPATGSDFTCCEGRERNL